MGIETTAKRVSAPEWRKHLRPWGKRVANGVVRRMDARLIAEFGPIPHFVGFLAGDENDVEAKSWCEWCAEWYHAEPRRGRPEHRAPLCPDCTRLRAKLVVPA